MTREAQDTLVVPWPQRQASTADTPSRPGELPQDLLLEAVKRLRILSLLFAFVFFMANFVPILIDLFFDTFPGVTTARTFRDNPALWLPGTVSIVGSLFVFWMTRSPRFAPRTLMKVGLVFGALGSYGIAFAEFWGRLTTAQVWLDTDNGIGLSYVAPWMVLYATVMPNLPRNTILSALFSSTAVSAVFGLAMQTGSTTLELHAGKFFFGLLFPYLLCALMAYSGARVVYKLGTDVRRARELGSYRLVEGLGQGGMGEVWRAKHRMLIRPAAIKLIRPEVLGASDFEARMAILKRFEREAQSTAAMKSPHTIELYDFGISSDGTFYYVMELLDGFNLETLINRFGPVTPERAIHLLTQTCESLAEAHEYGLTHRDVKPANIYACRYGRQVDFIKVLDFGLVKSSDNETQADLQLTADNVVGGTPAFMAPEQVLSNKPLDARTDIYALGCVGYWLLTGELVFKGENAMQTMLQHAHDTPIPPSSRCEVEIPAALDAVILACLEKAPDSRPQTADAVAELLAKCETSKPWTTRRAHQWWDVHHPFKRQPAA